METVVESSPAGLVILDDAARVLHMNAAALRILGVPARTIGGLFPPLASGDAAAMLQLLAQAPETDHQIRCQRGDGAAIEIAITASTMKPERDPRCYVVAFSDVTHRRAMDAHLQRAQRLEAIARLVGGIAHDFNNLLQVISGQARLASENLARGQDALPHLAEIAAAADLASAHTRQLLAFSRKQEARPALLRLDDAVRKALPTVRRVVGDDVTVEFEGGSRESRIVADPDQLELLLANLAVNAQAAMPDGGTLVLRTELCTVDPAHRHRLVVPPGEYVCLSVVDTGTGMDEATLTRLFEPFFTTYEGQGPGLGLAAVFGIVKQSGGYIVAESNPGQGSAFRVFFPPAPAQARISRPVRRRHEPAPSTGARILLVEDNEGVRTLLAGVLRRDGYAVLEAGDAESAIAMLSSGADVDTIVIDVELPGMSGITLAERILPERHQLGCLLISGDDCDDERLPASVKNRARLVQKPFSIPMFLECIRKASVSENRSA